jgi:hypothetical protein
MERGIPKHTNATKMSTNTRIGKSYQGSNQNIDEK